ncbi:hypothetical protein [Shewanella violacea]|uniref:hypothetical protein n=1 Tax=Shewanella violacea TaxID=60217 RepID=UPI0012FC8B29|nr:hypothetical protein [Shewanella violacea]
MSSTSILFSPSRLLAFSPSRLPVFQYSSILTYMVSDTPDIIQTFPIFLWVR